ncbi:hypothetical protein M3Y99_00221700 [Aphelenchoides fujianensis]|nr:hypothetical protein M3Y99_00221700 [Aphelenchoides fujianensis]
MQLKEKREPKFDVARSSMFYALVFVLVVCNLVQVGFLLHDWIEPRVGRHAAVGDNGGLQEAIDTRIADLFVRVIVAQSELIRDARNGKPIGGADGPLPVDVERLLFYGQMLENKCTLSEIVAAEEQVRRKKNALLFVNTPDRRRLVLRTSLSVSVGELRMLLQEHGFSRFQQQLSYRGSPLNAEDRALFEYRVQNASILDLRLPGDTLVYVRFPVDDEESGESSAESKSGPTDELLQSLKGTKEDEKESKELDGSHEQPTNRTAGEWREFVVGMNEWNTMHDVKLLLVDSWHFADVQRVMGGVVQQQKDGYRLPDDRPISDFDIYDRDVLEFVSGMSAASPLVADPCRSSRSPRLVHAPAGSPPASTVVDAPSSVGKRRKPKRSPQFTDGAVGHEENRRPKRKSDELKATDGAAAIERQPLRAVENPKRMKLAPASPSDATPKRATPAGKKAPLRLAHSPPVDLSRYPVLLGLLQAPSALAVEQPAVHSPPVAPPPPPLQWALQFAIAPTPPLSPFLQLQRQVERPHLSAEFFARPSWMSAASCGWESAASASDVPVYTNL